MNNYDNNFQNHEDLCKETTETLQLIAREYASNKDARNEGKCKKCVKLVGRSVWYLSSAILIGGQMITFFTARTIMELANAAFQLRITWSFATGTHKSFSDRTSLNDLERINSQIVKGSNHILS